jgi:hypothetical protein
LTLTQLPQSWTPAKCLGLLLVGCLLVPAGCGLAEYEKEMERQQKKLKQKDLEDELLGATLSVPVIYRKQKEKDEDRVGYEISIRAPKSISASKKEALGDPKLPTLEVYSTGNSTGLLKMEVGAVRVDLASDSQKERDWYLSLVKGSQTLLGQPPKTLGEDIGRKMEFQVYKAEGANLYFYLYRSLSYQVVIAFEFAPSTTGGQVSDRAVDVSLLTLRVP